MTVDVAVIGGGVSGLAAAHALRGRGHDVVVLERQVRAGGNAQSESIGGFLMEHGPSSVNAASAEALALSRSLGLDGARCGLGADVRHRYLVGDGALKRISCHPLGFLTASYLSPAARLRILAEPFIPARKSSAGDETVAGFWTRRFGREFSERVIDPLVGGLFAGVPEDLSMDAVFPRLVALERDHGSITRAMLEQRRKRAAMPGRKLFSWRGGVGELPASLARSLGAALKTGIAVRRIRPRPGGFLIDAGCAGSLAAAAVVIATQPHVAAALLEDIHAPGAAAAAAIAAPPLAVVFLGYARGCVDHPLDGLGYLTPRGEGRAMNGGLFNSTMFPGRAPVGHVALSGYFGGARAPDAARLDPASLIAMAKDEFAELLGIRGAPTVARVRQWPLGLPQHAPGHGARIATLREAEDVYPGLFLTGNYFAGPSIAVCLEQASAAAARADGHLRGRPERRRSDEAPGGVSLDAGTLS